MVKLGAKLKHLRMRKGLSQVAVARQAGISKAYYHQLEKSDRKQASAEILYKICKVLDVRLEWFFTSDDHCQRCGVFITEPAIAKKVNCQLLHACPGCYAEGRALEEKLDKEWDEWLENRIP